MRWCGGRSVMSSPKNRTRPEVGGKSPVIALNKVVLPAPLAPMMARRSPAATSNEMSSIATSAAKVRPTPASERACVAPTRADGDATRSGAIIVPLLRALGTLRVIAPNRPKPQELVARPPQGLVDLRDHLDDAVEQRGVGARGDLGQEDVGDGVAVVVELDLAGRRVELERRHGLAEARVVVGEVAVDPVERLEH